MADKKISDFTAATTVAAADLIEIETAAGNSRKVTGTNFANSMATLSSRGALVYNSADRTGINQSSGGVLTFNSEDYDTDGFHDTGSNTSRLTIPAGVSKVRLSFCIVANNVSGGTDCYAQLLKNGANMGVGNPWTTFDADSATSPRITGTSAIVSVSATDYFEINWQTSGVSSSDVLSQSWFAIEVIS